jgi:hypothetical protein
MRKVHVRSIGGVKVPRLIAPGLDAAVQAADAMVELGGEAATAVALKGREAALRAAAEAGRAANAAADATAGWAQRQIVRRVACALTPYLIEELVPEVIDGVMPKIRRDVVPAVVEDLAGDARIRAMVAQQSRGMLTWSVTEVRRASAGADDRVETALRRLLTRRGSAARP